VPLPPVRFLVPGTSGKFRCGGMQVELQSARLVSQLTSTEVVTYRQREADHPFLKDLLAREKPPGEELWIVSWGFDVPRLLRRLRGRRVAYHAHSSGYGFDLPPGVPVLAVSRNTLGYWGDRAPRNPLFYLPNALEQQWLERGRRNGGGERPIDVLVQKRKTSAYVLERLVPELRARGLRVEVQSGWVEDLVELFKSATVYLYDSAEYWRCRGVSEGFGLPPLEAMACGCVVFSSLNHALADSLDPGTVGHQIGCGFLEADLERIVAAVAEPAVWRAQPEALHALLASSSEKHLLERWKRALEQMEAQRKLVTAGALALKAARPASERWRRRLASLQQSCAESF